MCVSATASCPVQSCPAFVTLPSWCVLPSTCQPGLATHGLAPSPGSLLRMCGNITFPADSAGALRVNTGATPADRSWTEHVQQWGCGIWQC